MISDSKQSSSLNLLVVMTTDFDYFVVIDFEATCNGGGDNKQLHPQEIIEFPSVLVNTTTGQLESCFQTYVRPVIHPLLTDFCKELTGIHQPQVDTGVSLNEALLMHDQWLEDHGIKQKKFAVVTWSNWDCSVMLESERWLKGIRKPDYYNQWINLRVPFKKVFGGVQCNLKEAVEFAGLRWEGRQHCGLDDACNTARLLVALMRLGVEMSITNSLQSEASFCQCGDFSITNSLRSEASFCQCGVLRNTCVVRKPGPTQGRRFFGCGKWARGRGTVCNYFEWAY